jgi:hypothetical protein
MGASYISDISAIDVQGIVNKEQARKNHIEQLRRMALHLDMRAPSGLPFQENQRLFNEPEFVELLSIEDAMYEEMKGASSNENRTELAQKHQKAVFKRKRCYTRLYNQAFNNFRKQYFRTTNSEEIQNMIEQGEQGLPAEDECPSAPELKFVSSGHFPDRYFIANAFWTSCKAESTVPDPVLVGHIQKLYSPEPYVLYYPGESPVGSCCPVCRQLIEDYAPCDRPSHIHSYFTAIQSAQSEVKFENECPVQCK